MNVKPKIFVRYPPGASGHFIASLIYSFQKPMRLKNAISGHENRDLLSSWNTFNNHHIDHKFFHYTRPGINLEESVNYIKTEFKFDDDQNPYQFFVAHTHVTNPDPIMHAFENSKLINIKVSDDDADQLAYNFVVKNIVPYSWHRLPNLLTRFHSRYPNKLKNLTVDEISKDDVKLLTYLAKFVHKDTDEQRRNYSLNYDYFEIDWRDIINKNLVNKLDDLCKFLDIELTDARRKIASNMITQYADAQITTPWSITLDDFT
jgi:hypothetical protein